MPCWDAPVHQSRAEGTEIVLVRCCATLMNGTCIKPVLLLTSAADKHFPSLPVPLMSLFHLSRVSFPLPCLCVVFDFFLWADNFCQTSVTQPSQCTAKPLPTFLAQFNPPHLSANAPAPKIGRGKWAFAEFCFRRFVFTDRLIAHFFCFFAA